MFIILNVIAVNKWPKWLWFQICQKMDKPTEIGIQFTWMW